MTILSPVVTKFEDPGTFEQIASFYGCFFLQTLSNHTLLVIVALLVQQFVFRTQHVDYQALLG